MKTSILISSYNRLPLFRRCLWAIATRPPSCPFEVIVADDASTEDTLSELRSFSAKFPWKFIRVDISEFVEKTGIEKLHNNPCLTNNIAFKHASPDSEYIFQQGNEIIAWDNVYDKLIEDAPKDTDHFMVMSTTFDVRQELLDVIDPYGQNLSAGMVKDCEKWPLQSKEYRSDVTNYICLASRKLWETLQGYDERYFGGISAEDSDFVRRARCIPGFKQVVSEGLSLHQYHGGKTRYYNPKPSVISKQRWDEGVAINHAIYNAWDGTFKNRQSWPMGSYGVKEVITNQ